MKTKIVLALALITFFLYACKKSSNENTCTTVIEHPTTAEISSLKNYLTTSGITATEDSRGFFYDIVFSGTGTDVPVLTDSVTVQYKGTLINGTVFDSTTTGVNRKFLLSDLISGWRLGVPLIKKGGIINLYLPPAHGYGCASYGKLPSNAFTIFHIELIDF